MSSDQPDDDALTWAGDPETGAEPPKSDQASDRSAPVATGWKVVGKPGRVAEDPGEHGPRQTGSVALVAYGIIAGIYLLYTIGWLIAAQRDPAAPADIVGAAMYAVGLWLAVLAPALWIAATFWLTRAGAVRGRFVALVVGVIVLAPWPFITGGS